MVSLCHSGRWHLAYTPAFSAPLLFLLLSQQLVTDGGQVTVGPVEGTKNKACVNKRRHRLNIVFLDNWLD